MILKYVLVEEQEENTNSCRCNRKGIEGKWRKEIDTALSSFTLEGSREGV